MGFRQCRKNGGLELRVPVGTDGFERRTRRQDRQRAGQTPNRNPGRVSVARPSGIDRLATAPCDGGVRHWTVRVRSHWSRTVLSRSRRLSSGPADTTGTAVDGTHQNPLTNLRYRGRNSLIIVRRYRIHPPNSFLAGRTAVFRRLQARPVDILVRSR